MAVVYDFPAEDDDWIVAAGFDPNKAPGYISFHQRLEQLGYFEAATKLIDEGYSGG